MARLILQTAEGQQAVDLTAINSLGRHPQNSIQLLDKIVSKEHCIIELRGNGFVLRDLGSLNGTYVNNERVRGEAPLHHGDEITLGSTHGRFEDFTEAPQDKTAPNPSRAAGSQTADYSPGKSTHGTNPYGASYVAQGTRIDVQDEARQIGTQISAIDKGFLAYERIAGDPNQLRADYERLRLSHELSREIAAERDTTRLLEKILNSVFKFIRADRGVIFLRDDDGELRPRAMQRRDGTNAPITVSSTILNHVVNERAAVLTHDAALDFAASKGKSMILNRISSAIVAPLVAPLQNTNDVLGVLWLDSEMLARFQPKDLELVTAIAFQAAMFIEVNILGKKIEHEILTRERFSRLLSPNIAERVVSGELEVKQGGQRVERCAVFNSDIRGFTQMSENRNPEVLVEMLNEYFELMVDTIFKFEGTLDKFMGDGIMALWGAPVSHPDDAPRSVYCALEMANVLRDFNARRMHKHEQPLAIGVGIHSGPVVAGYIGSSKSLSYTVIGDVANTSARLCSIAAPGHIIVSETTLDELHGKFDVEELPPQKIRGKEKPMRLFNVLRPVTSVQVAFENTPVTAG